MLRRNFLKTSLGAAGAAFAFPSMRPGLVLAGPPALPAQTSNAGYAGLRHAFENPPIQNRNWTRWWWFGPQATKEGITYELEQMNKQGLAGVELNWMCPLEPDGNFAFLSDQWVEMVKFAVQKCKELGMRADFMLGTGWPYGGPWITPELASKGITRTVSEVVGPDRYGVKIPGDLGEHEKLVGLFAARTVGSDEVLDPASIVDLRPYLRPTDANYWAAVRQAIGWQVPEGRWKIIALKQAPTRQAVRVAALGDEGLILDHLSRSALERHIEVVGGALKRAVGEEFGKTVRGIFCDSFEILVPLDSYYWTDDYLEQFKKRKGYDLAPHLPALWYDVGEKTPYLRHDFVHVLSQLIMDNFFIPLREWCEQNNLISRVQSHGSVGELLQAYASNSIGEGEQVTLREPQVSMHRKLATSSAHIYGKPLTSAESFTFLSAPGYPSSYRYVVNLEILKYVLDPGLRDGYQEIINHGYTYNDPSDDTEPFHEMFASSVIRHTEPWWQYYNQFSSYVARCCSLLSQGRFVGDVAILSPIEDSWGKAAPATNQWWDPQTAIKWGEVAPLIVRSGFDFNVVNDQVLVERSSLEDGKLVIEKMAHSLLILPRMTYVALPSLERARDFCRGGGVVIALECLPEYATGFTGYEENGAKVRSIVAEMFGAIPIHDAMVRNKFGQGQAVLLRNESDLPQILREHLQADFELQNPVEAVLHLHRQAEDSDVYFVTNRSEFYQENSALFRTSRKSVERWDAETAEMKPVANYAVENKGVRIPFRLKPYESVFYIFKDALEPAHVVETNADEVALSGGGRVICTAANNGTIYIRTGGAAKTAGRKEMLVKDLPAPFEITGEWLVTFQAYKFAKLVKKFRVLHSWSDDADTRNFSGTARYELEFELPSVLLAKGRRVTLDLGTVADASKVWLNANAAGVTWKRPHLHDVTQWVKPGKNFIEVRISNRLINAVGGMKRPEWADKVVEKYSGYNERPLWYEIVSREYGSDMIPPAGLIGPVKLVFAEEIEFEI
jgi:hypothetical protein